MGADVPGVGDGTANQSQTVSVAEMATKGVVSTGTFGLIFNINENVGSDVVLHDFTMTFTDDTGNALFPNITYSPSGGGVTLDEVAGGQGGSGWLFHVNLTPSEESTLFGTSTNRVGMFITANNAIEMVSNGAEEFHVFEIPEPALLLSAVFALCVVLPLASRVTRQG
jgi:hypothetical protein